MDFAVLEQATVAFLNAMRREQMKRFPDRDPTVPIFADLRPNDRRMLMMAVGKAVEQVKIKRPIA